MRRVLLQGWVLRRQVPPLQFLPRPLPSADRPQPAPAAPAPAESGEQQAKLACVFMLLTQLLGSATSSSVLVGAAVTDCNCHHHFCRLSAVSRALRADLRAAAEPMHFAVQRSFTQGVQAADPCGGAEAAKAYAASLVAWLRRYGHLVQGLDVDAYT